MTTIQTIQANLPLILTLGLALIVFGSYLVGTGRLPLPAMGPSPRMTGSASLRSTRTYSPASPLTRRHLLMVLGAEVGGTVVWMNLSRLAALRATTSRAPIQPAASVAPPVIVPKVTLSQATIQARLSQGRPILAYADLNLDWTLVRQQWALTLESLAGKTSYSATQFAALKAITETELPTVVQTWFESETVSGIAAQYGVPLALLNLSLTETMQPFLAAEAKALLSSVSQEAWRKGMCPVCGGKPDFAYLDEESGARHLVCSRCDAHWLFQRVACPYCGNTQHQSLGYYTEDEGAHRLYVCDKCHGYLKAVDLRKLRTVLVTPLERTRTASLEKQAEVSGYRPGWQASPTNN